MGYILGIELMLYRSTVTILFLTLQISAESRDYMVEEYKRLRQRDSTGSGSSSWRITVRQLESMVRLSEAMARMHCSDEVSYWFKREVNLGEHLTLRKIAI